MLFAFQFYNFIIINFFVSNQIGDCAVFLSSGQLDRPFIGKVNCMWETNQEKMQVKVFWFYHPEETACNFTGNLPYPVSTIYIGVSKVATWGARAQVN